MHIPKLSEEQKKISELIIEEEGYQYHFSYGVLLLVLP
jgi:hypothetical protein